MAGDRDPARRPLELVTEAFGAEPDLLPLLPELFREFDALGAWTERAVALLRAADLPDEARLVDLGCGKGAVAVAAARELGCRVLGLDLFEPFLDAARDAARAAGVDGLCAFETADIRDGPGDRGPFDAANYAAVGAGLFGDYAGCVGALRRWVRPGGAIVIGDGFLRGSAPPRDVPPGYEYYAPRDEALRQLRAHGDELVEELLVPADEFIRDSRWFLERFRAAIERVLEARPDDRERLERYLAAQEAELRFMERDTIEVVWLLRKAPVG